MRAPDLRIEPRIQQARAPHVLPRTGPSHLWLGATRCVCYLFFFQSRLIPVRLDFSFLGIAKLLPPIVPVKR
jgi:hypothetical protein